MESKKPSFGSDLDKKDLDLYSPKYREVIEEFKKIKQDLEKTKQQNTVSKIHQQS